MQHIIIGAGPCGVVAAETLRKARPADSITLIGNEPEPPYSRMAIPYFLVNQIGKDGTYLRQPQHYQGQAIEYLNQPVTAINTADQTVTLADQTVHSYDRLLIATGSQPVSPPVEGIDLPNVHSCWTLEDAHHIAARATPGARVVLMGAGFIGCIILESLVKRGVQLTVVEMGDRMIPRMLDEKAGGLLKTWCIEKGVNVLTSTRITAIQEAGEGLQITLDSGDTLEADLVITATGVKPNTTFLQDSGIEIDHGVCVNTRLQTNIPSIYAAGDVAQGKDFSTNTFNVQAIQPTATDHARIAALNMAGQTVEHHGSLNMNVLDTLGLLSYSFGLWMGVENGDHVSLYNPQAYRYINLQFGTGDQEDVLIGASMLGDTPYVGIVRGLIESHLHLREWKERLLADPLRLMEAYLARTQAFG